MTRRHDLVPIRRIPYSYAPSAEAAHYPGLGAVTVKPQYLDAKRKTLAEFRAVLVKLPTAWKPKKMDAFVLSEGYYMDGFGQVRREDTNAIVFKLPGLSADQSVVFFSEEEFDPADDAWTYLSGLMGKVTRFPGRGGTVASTVNAIDDLLKKVDAQYGAPPSTSKWLWWLAIGAVGLVIVGSSMGWFSKGRK